MIHEQRTAKLWVGIEKWVVFMLCQLGKIILEHSNITLKISENNSRLFISLGSALKVILYHTTVYIYETRVYTMSLYLYPYALTAWTGKTLPLHMTYSINHCATRTVDAIIYILYYSVNYSWWFLQVYYVRVQIRIAYNLRNTSKCIFRS
jgi:hypothetical protein